MNMLQGPGGRERTEAEWRNLLTTAGFTLSRVVPLQAAQCVVEALPV